MLRQLCLLTIISSSVLLMGCAQNVEPQTPKKQTIYVYPKHSNSNPTPDKWTDYKPYIPTESVSPETK